MSAMSQEPSPDTDVKTPTDSQLPLDTSFEERRPAQLRAARLRVIQELVKTDNYNVPPLLIAERMLERAATPPPTPKD